MVTGRSGHLDLRRRRVRRLGWPAIAPAGATCGAMAWYRFAVCHAARSGSVSESCCLTSASRTLRSRRACVVWLTVLAVANTRALTESFRSSNEALSSAYPVQQPLDEVCRQTAARKHVVVCLPDVRHRRRCLHQRLPGSLSARHRQRRQLGGRRRARIALRARWAAFASTAPSEGPFRRGSGPWPFALPLPESLAAGRQTICRLIEALPSARGIDFGEHDVVRVEESLHAEHGGEYSCVSA